MNAEVAEVPAEKRRGITFAAIAKSSASFSLKRTTANPLAGENFAGIARFFNITDRHGFHCLYPNSRAKKVCLSEICGILGCPVLIAAAPLASRLREESLAAIV
ncbi:MAG: hypothetical protein DME26_08795 [Verrucomicrobia bacterium]|nr:MAG: hypothetical protein DME26_08795 [Verrucomicrobiota bacterium]